MNAVTHCHYEKIVLYDVHLNWIENTLKKKSETNLYYMTHDLE